MAYMHHRSDVVLRSEKVKEEGRVWLFGAEEKVGTRDRLVIGAGYYTLASFAFGQTNRQPTLQTL